MFVVKSSQIVRSGLLLLLLAPTLASSMRGDADQVIMLAMIVAGAVALMFQAVGGLRELASQGLTHDDLRNGITAIGEEEEEARAHVRSAPDWQERQKSRRWRIALGAVVAIALIALTFRLRVPLPNGGYQSPTLGIIAAALGVMIGAITLVYALAGGGATRLDRRLRRLWTGSVGRRLFDFVSKRVGKSRAVARVVSLELGPLTLVESLPKDLRRELGDVSRVINELVAEQNALLDRETRLTSSQTDASRGSSGAATDTLDRVISELSEAKIAAAHKREAIAAELERLRLELIRLRSGVGTSADVLAEVNRAREMLR
jgi:hypothetical protein